MARTSSHHRRSEASSVCPQAPMGIPHVLKKHLWIVLYSWQDCANTTCTYSGQCECHRFSVRRDITAFPFPTCCLTSGPVVFITFMRSGGGGDRRTPAGRAGSHHTARRCLVLAEYQPRAQRNVNWKNVTHIIPAGAGSTQGHVLQCESAGMRTVRAGEGSYQTTMPSIFSIAMFNKE